MIARLEGLGVNSFWLYEIFQGYEAFARAGYLAAKTEKATVGVGVLNSYSRHPAITAMGASFLSNTTKGRASVILGIGGDSWVGRMLGYEQARPRERFTEYVGILRRLLRGEEVNHQTSNFTLNKVKLNPVPEHSIPLVVACEQPKMMELAGQVGDGVYLEPSCCPMGYIKWAARTTKDSRAERREFRVIANLPLAITNDIQASRDSVKPMLAFHLSFPGEGELYLEKAGFPASLSEEIGNVSGVRQLIRQGRAPTGVFGSENLKKAAAMVPDEFVDQCAVMGDIDECRDRLSQLEAVGLTDIVFSFQDGQDENLKILSSYALLQS